MLTSDEAQQVLLCSYHGRGFGLTPNCARLNAVIYLRTTEMYPAPQRPAKAGLHNIVMRFDAVPRLEPDADVCRVGE